METDRLRYFCTIYETESLTRASELLNVSHSGLSKAMAVLQQEIGVALFTPQGRGIQPTEQAHPIYKKSKELLAMLERLSQDSEPPSAKKIRLGVAEIFSYSLAGKLPDAFKGEAIEVHEFDAGEAEICLLQGRIDFAVTFVPFPRPEIEYLKIASATFGVFKRTKSFLSTPREELPFVVPTSFLPGNPLSLKIRDGWPAGVERLTSYSVSSLTLALQLVSAGHAVIFIPHFLAAALNALEEVKFPAGTLKESKREIFIVKRKNSEETAPMKAVARLIRLSCKEV